MTKYKISYEDTVIEFATEQAAIDYKEANNLSEEIESFIEEIVEVVEVPRTVTPRQMRVALVMTGITVESIESLIDGLEEPTRSVTRITWEYSTAFERDNPVLNAMAPLLGLNSDQVDELFVLASTI
jgi:hypothetical protein